MKLHLGCGERYFQGYVNIDFPLDAHSVQTKSVADLHANILDLRYSADSINEIRLHHVFEHFTRPVALALLASWSSWLTTGGILHIEVPNFHRQTIEILNPQSSFSTQALGIRHLFGSHEASWAVHCEGYSPQSLQYILEQYGYSITVIRENDWEGTYNFEIIACKKAESKVKDDYLEITRGILCNYLLNSSEHPLLNIWLEIYKAQVEKSWGLQMEILLSYCKTHFDPDKRPEEHQYWDSSAAIIARGLYNVLGQYGNVTYIQPNELSKIQGKHYDLFVGRDLNFNRILQCAHITKSIYVAVNMHYIERNNLIQGFISQGNLPIDAISGQDLVYTADQIESLTLADHILCFGNNKTMNTYLKNGVELGKIHALNYDVGDVSLASTVKDETDHTWRYLYVASEIGLRKGFDILYDIFTNKLVADRNIRLDIVGEFSTPYHQQKYETMKTLLGDKVNFHGWIDSGTTEYRQILEDSDFIVFPSIEEGQPGTVLDAIKCQVVPILTKNCGIDFSPLGMLDIQIGSASNVNIVLKSMNLTQQEYLQIKKHTVDYYTHFHQDWIVGLSKLIANCMNHQLYPRISVILPIYNKEHSIQELLLLLHKACTRYSNIQLILFFDGCEDRTEEAVKKFFDEHPPSYEVMYNVTPNLFETRTNNLGIQQSTGEYCVIIQDDTYIYDENIFFEIASFMDKAKNCAIVGGLAGVNYYPIGFKLPPGSGQQVQSSIETYWRQDGNTDPTFQEKIFQTDAVMRGPFVIRKAFIDQFGALDESYVPFCVDDMDICYRAKALGYDIYCMLMNVENRRLSMTKYNSEKYAWFVRIYERNLAMFYHKWKPSTTKDYSWIHRFKIVE